MNILIVANHYAVCSARYAADAFTRMGHTIKHVGQPMGRDIWGMQVPEEYVWRPDADFPFIDARNVIHFKYDAVIAIDSDPSILDWCEGFETEVPTIVWGVDSHVRDYRRPYFDAYFLAHKAVSIQPYDENTFWLPCATDPVAFPPSPIPWADREYDVCMVGVMYPKRWELVNAMRAAGLKVFAGTGLVYEAYKQAHWNSRVALVSSFNGDLPIRLFEGAGMGCAVLCDQIGDLSLLDGDGTGMLPLLVYGTDEQAVKMAVQIQNRPNFDYDKWLLHNTQWASHHTWNKRAQVIIDWLEAR